MGDLILDLAPALAWPGQAWRFMTARRGGRRADLFLRGTGAVAAAGIPLLVFFPSSAPLVWLAIISVPANGPLSPIMPAVFEPLIMEAAKTHAPLWVTLVGVAAQAYVEVLNLCLYRWVLTRERLRSFREHDWIKRSVGAFGRRPALTIAVFAFTPLPFWVARILALLHGYSPTRYLIAMASGRLPRIFLYAAAGDALDVPTWILAAVMVVPPLVIVLWRLARRRPVLQDVVVFDFHAAESARRTDVD